jgi:hypothetical protein
VFVGRPGKIRLLKKQELASNNNAGTRMVD